MKLYYHDNGHIAFFETVDNLALPCDVDITNGAGHIAGENPGNVTVYDSVEEALQSVVDVFADAKNKLEISGVNDSLAKYDYVNARMRKHWSGYVTPSETNPDVFSLSISPRLVENNLLSDDFTAEVFKKDISFLYDLGMRISKGEKLGNKWKKAITALYNGYTGDSLRESIKDDFKLEQGTVDKLGTAWADYTITAVRMEFLRGCYVTTHVLKSDTFGVSGKKARFVNVLLSTDTDLARKKSSKKA